MKPIPLVSHAARASASTAHGITTLAAAVSLAFALTAAPQRAHAQVEVGGAVMEPSRDIVDNTTLSKDHTTFVRALLAAGLVDTLKGPGPFTVFAPTDTAFDVLPPGTVETLLVPENRPTLGRLLRYHVVAGRLDAAALTALMKANDGRAVIKTLSGGTLVLTAPNGAGVLTDENGGRAQLLVVSVPQSNGVVHVIDKVLLPR